MQLYDIAVLKGMVSFRHHPVVLTGAPDAGILQAAAEVLMHFRGGVLEGTPPGEHDGVVELGLLTGRLGIYPDNIQHLEYFIP